MPQIKESHMHDADGTAGVQPAASSTTAHLSHDCMHAFDL